jgi:hypothetical protein
VMDTDLRISPDRSSSVPFDMLVSGMAGIVVESVLASDMTTSFADPVEEAEPVDDTDSMDDFRLAQSSLLLFSFQTLSLNGLWITSYTQC